MKSARGEKGFVSLIIALAGTISITGISLLDSSFWNLLFRILGMIAYGIVGVLYAIGAISTKKGGSEAFWKTLAILIILGFFIYEGMGRVQNWFLSWALGWKIVFFSVLGAILIFVVFLLIKSKISSQEEKTTQSEKG